MRKKYFAPNLKQSFIIILLLFLGSFISGIIPLIFGPDYPGVLDLIITPISYCLVFIYFFYKTKKLEEESFDDDPKYRKINDPYFGAINPVLLFIISLLMIFSLNTVLEPLLSWIKAPEWYKEAIGNMMDRHIIISIISVAVYAALFEEFVCRGLMLRGLLRDKTPFQAILWSSFIFALMHMNFYQGVPAFILGCMLGWLYYKTRSIWLPIFLHFSNNLFSTIMEKVFPDMDIDTNTWELIPMKFYIPLYILSLIILIFSIYYINKKIKPHECKEIISDKVPSDN